MKYSHADVWKECTELCYLQCGFVDRGTPLTAVDPTHLNGAGMMSYISAVPFSDFAVGRG
jgi:hypothetical protein